MLLNLNLIMGKQRAISINMPVYNGEKYVEKAIRSVLDQTFSDFEFIILDDGSTDATPEIINSFSDDRIISIRNEHDFVKTLNMGLDRSSGKYFVRMDSDDIMHAERLEIQHTFMEKNPEIDVYSTWMLGFNGKGENKVWKTVSGYVENPLLQLLYGDFVCNPTSMIRKEFVDTHAIRYDAYRYAGDFKFWSDAAKYGARFYVDSQLLHYYRFSEEQVSVIHKEEQTRNTIEIKKEIILALVEKQPMQQAFGETYRALKALSDANKITDKLLIEFFYKLFQEQKITADPDTGTLSVSKIPV